MKLLITCLVSFVLVLSFAGNALAQLPDGWSGRDIGVQAKTGTAFENNGQWTVIGSGSETWYHSDVFYYAYRTVLGDGEITARVVSAENTHEWAMAGVMIRETLDADSKYAFMTLTPSGNTGFLHRVGQDCTSRQQIYRLLFGRWQ
jgi:hypothetical protein